MDIVRINLLISLAFAKEPLFQHPANATYSDDCRVSVVNYSSNSR